MKTSFLFLTSFLAVCFISLSFAQDDTEQLKTKIREMNEKYSKAMLERNYEAMLSFYADDAISLPSYSPMMKGKEAIKNGMDMDKNANYKITEFKMVNTDIITSGDLVCDIGTYNMAMEMQGMDSPVTDEGKYMTVYQKQPDGSLKIKAETWNTDKNPWMK